jgi:uncharacterized iron-regulated membrane protein
MKNSPPAAVAPASGALYRAVWRWHFYAGLVAAPFALWLAFTGALYLWKPQYEEWRYRDLLNVPAVATSAGGQTALSAEAQLAAARAAYPKLTAVQFIPAFQPGRTAEVQFGSRGSGEKISVFVNPATAAIVGERRESDRLMTTIHDLHGSLLAGRTGEIVIELAASWMFVLLLTGFYLWWPRPKFTVWGFLLPRLRGEGRTSRVFWRDLHAVPAVWFSAGALFLLATGLPWTKVGGAWLRTVSAAMGEGSPKESAASAHRSELTGWSPPLRAGVAQKIDALASAPAGHEGHEMPAAKSAPLPPGVKTPPRISLDRAMAIAAERGVPQPYAIALPAGPAGVMSAMSDRNQAFTRTYLHLDQYSGRVLADVRYGDYGLVGKFFLWGIIAHEGQLFGLLNQILGTLACAGVFLMAASGLALWWQRKPGRRLAAPASERTLPRPVVLGTGLLALFLPLLAASLVVMLIFDRLFARRFNSFPVAYER